MRIVTTLAALLLLHGCTDEAQEAAALAQHSAPQPGGVVVRLAFGEEADLDLYVTDPLMDTVYFARHESRTGGRIVSDIRCETPTEGLRIEEIRFDAPWPGRYRVGVDHPKRCDDARAPAPSAYALTVFADGEVHEKRGSVNLQRFEVIVLEFEVKGEPNEAT